MLVGKLGLGRMGRGGGGGGGGGGVVVWREKYNPQSS